MNELLAHSASENAPAQSYRNHVQSVVARARCYLRKILLYAPQWQRKWALSVLTVAGQVHDLGKLDDANQQVLRGEKRAAHLPVNHVDAGVAYLLQKEFYFAALLVRSHHNGLLDYRSLEDGFRDSRVQTLVDRQLDVYVGRHEKVCGPIGQNVQQITSSIDPVDVRLMFSCLVHADHGDTAEAKSGRASVCRHIPKLRPQERLKRLNEYVESLSAGKGDKMRQELRRCFFVESCNSEEIDPIVFCDAPVGSGKTTAVMAYLLRMAATRKLRRIFVILPYTSIITQSATVYRKALTLKGEDARSVVAEIHHRADFEDAEARKLTALWDAPIIITTAVAFFETLASNRTSTLRRLQNLPGSAVFLDEAHAMLPIHLLPLAWQWICHMSDAGMCHWVLASGSLAKFWRFPELVKKNEKMRDVPDMIAEGVSEKLKSFERRRVNYLFKKEGLLVEELVEWMLELDGPVILVLNTVHTAAVVAKALSDKAGEDAAYHLSTALTPQDREMTLKRVLDRLGQKGGNQQWFLIATSCVEAGMDFSFRTGVREMASVASLIQMAGRVNRNAEYETADVWSFSFALEENRIKVHPGFVTAANILNGYFCRGDDITAESCTLALKQELVEAQAGNVKVAEELITKEGQFAFKTVAETFRVIQDNSELVVVDAELIRRIEDFEQIDWQQIQRGSVRIRRKLLERVAAAPSARYPEIWLWKYPYSSFLGYMEYLLQLENIDSDSYAIV